ncbi:stress response protein NST1-like [Pecten maximus]|uniref:stress response protein NST1-like n=1 Tax=Pecten maximus TaxID=6579 RepID=UPI0014589C00|nr:stress response protein NST1-like [Pecten maximus]
MAAAYHNDDTRSSDTSRDVTNALEVLSEEENKDFQDFRKSLGIVGSFTKQMVKLAIDQLKPEFERMAEQAADRAMDSKSTKVKELQDELNGRERDLKQMKLEKKILQAKLEKEMCNRDIADVVDSKEKDIKKMEVEIGSLKSKLKRKADELKKERERATDEETRRMEIQTSLQSEIDRLKKDLDKVKGHLGQIRSAKNVGNEETRKLRERERQLIEEIEDLKKQQPKLRRKITR